MSLKRAGAVLVALTLIGAVVLAVTSVAEAFEERRSAAAARDLQVASMTVASADLVRSLGADEVLDYTRDDVFGGGETYDVVFDAVDKLPVPHDKVLRDGGVYLNVATSSGGMGTGREHGARITQLEQLLEDGALRSVVDRRYPLEDLAHAHAYVELGHKRGNVLIDVG